MLALAAGLLAAIVIPGSALAARGLTTGFQSDYYQSPDPATRDFWLKKTVDADAGIIRLNVPWITYGGTTKPADPSNPATYNGVLTDIDNAVRDARAHGLQVMLTANGAPPWAEGPGRPADAVPGSWRPNPADFGDFVKALAQRYSGSFSPPGQPALPAAQALEVWNEPNTSGAITPTFEGKTDTAANIYRDLLNSAYDAVKSVNPGMLVVTGGTAPYGDPPGGPYPPGIQRVRPVTFWEDVLCVQPVKSKKKSKKKQLPGTIPPTKFVRKGGCNGPVKFDVLSHHAIDNTGKGPLQSGPTSDDASTPDLGRITAVLRGAEKAGTTSGGRHRLWVTEFWWDSNPPNPSGANLQLHARQIEQSLYLFWKAGADTAFNFVIGDTATRPNVHAGFQGGAYFQDGRPKPALTAFQFPFVTSRINANTLEAWGRSPEAGKVLIQRKQGGWKTIRRISVGKGSVFDTKLKLSGKQQLRAKVGSTTSLIWKQAAFGSKGKSSGGGPSATTIILALLAAAALTAVAFALFRRRQRPSHDRRDSRLRHQVAATSGRPT
jgi:hypothetical protein